MAASGCIFKVCAIADFIAPKAADGNALLSFRQSQAFYVLSTDQENGLYFVSTQYSTPFARSAICGRVPISYFEQVDLLGGGSPVTAKKIAPPARPAPAAAAKPGAIRKAFSYLSSNIRRHSDGNLLAPSPDQNQQRRSETIPRNVSVNQVDPRRPPLARSTTLQQHSVPVPSSGISTDRIIDAELISAGRTSEPPVLTSTHPRRDLVYTIRVRRQRSAHLLSRSYTDFLILSNSLSQFFGPYDDSRKFLPVLPPPFSLAMSVGEHEQLMEVYLSHLCHTMPVDMFESGIIKHFFSPRSEAERNPVDGPRRDSGFSVTESAAKTRSRQPSVSSKMDQVSTLYGGDERADGADHLAEEMRAKLSMVGRKDRISPPHAEFDAEEFMESYK
ncbi:hypothetical protein HKX48_000078 [Thoreauomyces humboldtii]|nr:hypothetical protein HKX48_000078 [Thoreauomyces humboldtii]